MNGSFLLTRSGYLGRFITIFCVCVIFFLWGCGFPISIFFESLGNGSIAATFFLMVKGLGRKELKQLPAVPLSIVPGLLFF